MKVILLAAGFATRLYPLTETQPKALLPAGGRPVLDWILDSFAGLKDLTRVILMSNAKFYDAFRTYASTRSVNGLPIEVHHDGVWCESEQKGALGDLLLAMDAAGEAEDWLVLSSDNLFTYSLREAQAAFYAHGHQDMVLGQRLADREELKRMGVARVDADNRVIRMEEKSPNPISDIAVYATYFYRAETRELLRHYLAQGGNPDSPGHFPAWLCSRVPVWLHPFEGVCIDMGTPESYEAVRVSWDGTENSLM